ncbi:nucleotidyltransferase substrate binding protein [Mariniphaga sp.]|uniref:nucleotidyltransferase substrate binding protein n=1 Tax=Mariniphaga sp. TaxID=1954475 RepID=UPI0035620F8D
MEEDIRWKQRFSNYKKAFEQLTEFIEKGDLNKFEEQGLIQAFEYTFELAWNLIKDYFEYQGEQAITGSRDAFRLAFKRGLISDGESWMDMIASRIKSSHTYHEETAEEIVRKINDVYFDLFSQLYQKMKSLL